MSRNSPMGQLGMKLPLRRPAQEEPAPTTPRWPQRYGEPAAPQHHQQAPQHHQAHDYGQQGHSQQQAAGYYFPQAAREADAGHGYAPQGHGHPSPVAPAFGQQPPAQHHQRTEPAQGYAPAQHGSLPFNRLPGADAAAAQDYSAHASNQSLPFNRFPPPAAEPAPNYGYSQQGAEPSFGSYADGSAHQQQPGAGPPWSQQPDARGFDLGTYMPAAGQAPGDAYSQQADLGQQHDPSAFGGQQHGYAETDQEYDETFGEEEPSTTGRRGLMIVAALVGAIGLGGGMAYTYKTFFAPRSGPAVVIKDTQGPAKSKPEVADGKGFPHTDKKLLARLGEDASRPPPASEGPAGAEASGDRLGDDPNGPRRVRTIQIMPGGGSAQPPPVAAAAVPPAAPPAGGPAPMVSVPGVTLENFGMPRPPPQGQAMPRPMAPQQQGAPPSAARIELPPSAASAPPARPVQPPMRPVTAAATPPPAAVASVPPPAAKPVKTAVPKSKPAAPVAASSTSAGSGYVAVLSSKKTRMDALKAFADMQQKYGDVLSAKTPDVQEANLGEKGVWYRAVAGPPGSREAAANLCSQLKTAGHEGCWVTAY
jgi:hypothetical protein